MSFVRRTWKYWPRFASCSNETLWIQNNVNRPRSIWKEYSTAAELIERALTFVRDKFESEYSEHD